MTSSVTITIGRDDLPLRLNALHWPGEGPPVVLVHGMVVAGRSLIPLAMQLARQGFAVWVPDLPGFGASERPRRALGVDGLADALAAWAASLELPPVSLVGNSFGTQVATALVHRHPGVARRLALVAPTIDARLRRRVPPLLRARHDPQEKLAPALDSSFRKVLQRFLVPSFGPETTPSLRHLILCEYALAGPRRVLSTYGSALTDDLEARMPAIDVPVLVARGAQDKLVSSAWAARLACGASAGRYVEIAGVDHDAEYYAPTIVADTLAPFLRGDHRPTAG